MSNNYTVPEEYLNKVIAYLQQRPFVEVNTLLQEMTKLQISEEGNLRATVVSNKAIIMELEEKVQALSADKCSPPPRGKATKKDTLEKLDY